MLCLLWLQWDSVCGAVAIQLSRGHLPECNCVPLPHPPCALRPVPPAAGESRGFAFINFIHREDANRAIAKLDGFGYDNLILSVSMAAPRPERP